jgi:FHS family glucose/mannose:H+ symporter-like MFS transporter
LWLFAAIIFLYVGIETSCAAWLYTFLAKFTRLDLSLCAFSMSVLWGGLTFGRLISIKLCSKYSPYLVTTLATVLIMASLALLSSFSGLGFLALALVFLMGLGFAPIYPNSVGLANERYPAAKSTATMVVICSGSLGGTLLPLAIGAAFTKLSLQFGMSSLALVALVMSFLVRSTRQLAVKKEPPVVAASLAANLNDETYCEIQS